MRTALLLTLVALVVPAGLAGCSLARGGHTERAVMPARPGPARAWWSATDERLALRTLGAGGAHEAFRGARSAVDAHLRAEALPAHVEAPEREAPDPVRGTFDSLPEGHRWMPEAFLPSGGTLDLLHPGRGRLYVRAWNRDQDFRGGGLGWTVPLGSGWHAAAELGVDPQRPAGAGGTAIVAGFGVRL